MDDDAGADSAWAVDDYKVPGEEDARWLRRRSFMVTHMGEMGELELVFMSQLFTNLEFMCCKYPDEAMHQLGILTPSAMADECSKAFADKSNLGCADDERPAPATPPTAMAAECGMAMPDILIRSCVDEDGGKAPSAVAAESGKTISVKLNRKQNRKQNKAPKCVLQKAKHRVFNHKMMSMKKQLARLTADAAQLRFRQFGKQHCHQQRKDLHRNY